MHSQPVNLKRALTLIYILICLLTLISYGNTLHVPFQFDDKPNIVERKDLHLQKLSLSNILDTFTKPDNNQGSEIYRPVSCLSFALNYYIGGLNVTGYHLVNLAIHLTALFFLLQTLILLLTYRGGFSENRDILFAAGCAAVIWAVHPIQINAVTYIVQRMASLAAMFYIIGLWAYLKFRLFKHKRYLAVCILSALLAVFSKQNAALFPAAVLLVEFFFFNTFDRINRKSGLVVASCLGMIIIYAAFRLDFASIFQGYAERPFTPAQRILTEPRVLFQYIYQMIAPLPENFSIDHGIRVSESLFKPVTTIVSIAGICIILTSSVLFRKKYPIVCFSAAFFLIHHAVESTILPLELVFEHRNYLPSMFVFLPPAMGMAKLIAIYRERNRFVRFCLVCIGIFGFMFLSMATYNRNFDWRSAETLWRTASVHSPELTRPMHNLGSHYQKTGNTEKALDSYRQALENRVHDRKWKKYLTYRNMASIYYGKEQWENAEKAALHAMYTLKRTMEDKDAAFKEKGGKTIYRLSAIYAAEKPEKAQNLLEKLIRHTQQESRQCTYLSFLGRILMHHGKPEQAVAKLKKALKLDSSYPQALLAMGAAQGMLGEYEKGMTYFKRYKKKNNQPGEALLYMADNRISAGKKKEAKNFLEEYTRSHSISDIRKDIKRLQSKDPKKSLPLVTGPAVTDALERYIKVSNDMEWRF